MSLNPQVSVAIIFFNQAKYVEETVSSVVRQKTSFDYEIVCGDDASTDGTFEALKDLEKKHPSKIRVLRQAENSGLLMNTHFTLGQCRGRYIATLGGDDLFEDERKLQKQYDFLERNGDYGLVYTDARVWAMKDGRRVKVYDCLREYGYYAGYPPISGDVREDLMLRHCIFACTAFFRNDLYQRYVDLPHYKNLGFPMEDLPIYYELAVRSKFHFIDEPMSVYRVCLGSVSRPKNKDAFYKAASGTFDACRYLMDKYPVSETTQKRFLEKYHRFALTRAFDYRHPGEALESLNRLRDSRSAGFLEVFYYWASRFGLFWMTLKLMRKLSSRFRLVFW